MEDFETRRHQILCEIVEFYIQTATPVGSQAIASRLSRRLSPATIRNIMHELEEAGFLVQPHTSAGRVPTERGYRLYVNRLLQDQMQRTIRLQAVRQAEFESQACEVEPLLERACAHLAASTGQTAFVLAPTIKQSKLRQIQFVWMNSTRVLCVLVSTDEIHTTNTVGLSEATTPEELNAVARFVNTELAGVSFDRILQELERRLLSVQDDFHYLIKLSLEIFSLVLQVQPLNRLIFDSTSHIMAQPEFRQNPELLERLLHLLESQEELLPLLMEDLKSGQVWVRIGGEIGLADFDVCSYVAGPIELGERVVGGIGVIGPIRMDYPRINQAVESVSNRLTQILGSWELG